MNSTDTVIVIGGSSGMGLAVARRCLTAGASVVIAGRSPERLDAARTELACPDRVRVVTADIGRRAHVKALFEQAGAIRHVVVTAADLPYGPVAALTEDAMMRAVRSKFLGPFFVAQEAAARMKDGSITLTSGIAAYRPAPGGALAASVNGALEAMVRAFALELAPVRVNAVSPGWVDTPIWAGLATPEAKQARFADMASRLPGRRTGTPADVARAIGYLIEDDFVTGTVLHAEGGQLLV
ncbi:MAG TPA: SDR family oxidoreductase [Streptosporangiaceae bacterium]|jgi:NAD(P)-dependent dehydrogenase (short-subunit alcohol dehydrogenase family)|nr:SDR family oxidoreductase [Streptosporangiaceae bacterium]